MRGLEQNFKNLKRLQAREAIIKVFLHLHDADSRLYKREYVEIVHTYCIETVARDLKGTFLHGVIDLFLNRHVWWFLKFCQFTFNYSNLTQLMRKPLQ
jgi:hypothetical protein